MIEVQHLSKFYHVHVRQAGLKHAFRSLFNREFRTVKAVDDISFSIPEGQIVGFLGPNGAGKTTTMKVLTGLLHPTSGQITVGGFVPFQHQQAFKRKISLVMGQKGQLIWDVPAAETFLVNKVIYGISDKEYKENLGNLTDLLNLHDLMIKPVRQLSLGERMKCELAASLLHKPEIVFLDEPTIGLDVNMQETVRQFIAEYNRHFKATILLTSHYMADVTALCERVMVINRGKLLYDGSIQQLVDRYAPHKRIKLHFAKPVDRLELVAELGDHAKLADFDAGMAELEVVRTEVSSISAKLFARFPIMDVTIEDPSMESVISRAFESA
jgi:ABC-2 type transport system ATP-binding protein